jgi:hypothetical protein
LEAGWHADVRMLTTMIGKRALAGFDMATRTPRNKKATKGVETQ